MIKTTKYPASLIEASIALSFFKNGNLFDKLSVKNSSCEVTGVFEDQLA
jgi:hypothetical protein